MAEYKVAEIFDSVNGEGTRSGQLALFVRMQGCNLDCSYCDTRRAGGENAECMRMSAEEIRDAVRRFGFRNVTLTGGEPLLQEGMALLLLALTEDPRIRVEIETNGSVPLAPLLDELRAAEESGTYDRKTPGVREQISFNMDYKLPGSGMERYMIPENFEALAGRDTVKFVVGDRTDLKRSLELITAYDLTERCRVFLSPVFGRIEPKEIVDFMKEHRLNDVTLQLQIHKIIWDPETSGV